MTKVYFPQDKAIRVHLSRVKLCPSNFPAGFYWYGGKKRGSGHQPKWVEQMMAVEGQMEAQAGDKSLTNEESHAKDQQDGAKGKRRKSTGQRNELEGKKKNSAGGQPVAKNTRTRQVLPPVQYS